MTHIAHMPLLLLIRLQYLQKLLVGIRLVRESQLDLIEELNRMIELPSRRLLHSLIPQITQEISSSSRLRTLHRR